MSGKLTSILNYLSRKPKTNLIDQFKSKKNHLTKHLIEINVKNSLLSLWNNKEIKSTPINSYLKEPINEPKPVKEQKKNKLIEEDPFFSIGTKSKEFPMEKPKERHRKVNNLQECIVKTLFPDYEISLNKEGFIKEFRNFIALKGNEIFPDYKFISKIIKKLEYGEELMQSKTIFKMEWLSMISLLFYINVVYFKDFQNYNSFITYLPLDKNKRTLVINENSKGLTGTIYDGEIRESITDLVEKLNPNFSKSEVEKMKLDEIQKYSRFLGISVFKEGKVGYVNKTKEELTSEIFPMEVLNEI